MSVTDNMDTQLESVFIPVSDEMMSEAESKSNITTGEDFERSTTDRNMHRLTGELGEIAFNKFLEDSPWSYDWKGGSAEPDFVLHTKDNGSIKIDTKIRINPENRDLIIKKDFTFNHYILMYIVWEDPDKFEKYPDTEVFYENRDEIKGVEIAGFTDKQTVNKHGEDFNPYSSSNNRPKRLLDQKHIKPLYNWTYTPK
jgi:hypothetical protein